MGSRGAACPKREALNGMLVAIVTEKLQTHSLPRVGDFLLQRPVAGCAKWFDNDVHHPQRQHDFNKSFDRIEPFHRKSSEQDFCQ